MIDLDALAAELPDIPAVEITRWVARGWVRPAGDGERWRFAEIDVARVRLIRDLTHEMALDEDAVPVVLSLLDQVHELRAQLRQVATILRRAD